MAAGGGGERTEKATPKKLKKARREGHIGNSPEFGSWLGMLAASFLLPHIFRSTLNIATDALYQVPDVIKHPSVNRAGAIAENAVRSAATTVLPLGALMAVIGVAAVAAQGGIYFAPKLLKPQFSRLNPLHGLKRMFGGAGAWMLTKSVLKTAALAAVVYLSVRHLVPSVYGSGSLPLDSLLSTCLSTVLNLIRYASAAGLVMAGADFAVTRRRNNKQTKMTKQEIKDEFKDSEGDPRLKGLRRSRALAMARSRMMASVPHADVVVVNPTHVAVALKYDPNKGAPRVLAKGADHVASRIRQLADDHRIPMVVDVPLARTLYQTVEVGHEIPPDLYKGVATVLAFIMNLRKRGSVAGLHTSPRAA